MSDLPNSSVIDPTIPDAIPGTFGAAVPKQYLPTIKNYAEDMDVRNQIYAEVVPVLWQTRSDKMALHDEWQAIRNMEMLKHDAGKKYNGRSDSYIPVFNRNSSTLVSSLSRGLFPSDEYFDVSTLSGTNLEEAKTVKAYLQWEFEKVAQVRRHFKPWLKQFVNYGNAVLKYGYKKEHRYEGRLSKVKPEDVLRAMFTKVPTIDGLQVSARSIFNVYTFPANAENVDDCTMIFEDIYVNRKFIEEMLRLKIWARPDVALMAPRPPEMDSAEVELFNARGQTSPPREVNNEGIGNIRAITEVWTYLNLPRDAYLPEEDKECMLPVLVVLAGTEPIYVGRNPFWHQKPPYLFGRMNVEPGFFYGYGFGRVIRGIQYLTNDSANQMNDVGIIGMNPYTLVNPGLLAGPLPPLRPGATIPVTDVNMAVKWDRPPTELIQYGMQLLSLWSGMSQDFGGAPPILQGQAAGKTGKTATGAQILQRNAMMPLQDVVEDLELDVMVPLLKGAWINAQQYRDEAVMINVAGQSLKVDPAQLAIDAEMRWLASSQAVNQQMRAQQAIQLLQAIMPIVPLIVQQGYVIDPVPLIEKVHNDGFGFRGFNAFIHKASPQEMMQALQQSGALQQAQNPQAAGPEQEDRIRSALEQSSGGSGEMAPGEGEDFMSVRQGADEMAATAGANGGLY